MSEFPAMSKSNYSRISVLLATSRLRPHTACGIVEIARRAAICSAGGNTPEGAAADVIQVDVEENRSPSRLLKKLREPTKTQPGMAVPRGTGIRACVGLFPQPASTLALLVLRHR